MAGKNYLPVWVLAIMIVMFSNAIAQEKSEFPDAGFQTQNLINGGKTLQAMLGVSHEGWMQLGPEGGDVRSIAMSPEDHNILYCLAYGNPSSIFRTINGGFIWGRISAIDQFLNTLAIDPDDARTLYAAGEGWHIYKSVDYGLSWVSHQLGTDATVVINEISVSSIDNNVLYAVGHSLDLTSVISVFQSVDAGISWKKYEIDKSDTGYGYGLSLALDPSNRDIVYVGGYHYDGFGRKGVLYKSINGGKNWTNIYSGITGFVHDIVIHPYQTQRLLVATPFGIYRTTDGGISWKKNEDFAWAYRLAVDPVYFDLIYGGAYEKAYKSIDGGVHWTAHSVDFSGNCSSLLVDYVNNDQVYYGGSNGIYKSTDVGENWTVIDSGLVASTVTTMAIAPSASDTIYIASPGKGLFKSINFGTSWRPLQPFVSSTNITAMAVNPLSPDVIYALEGAGPDPAFLSKSEDGGQTWKQIDSYFDDGGAILIDPHHANTVYIGGKRLQWPKVMAVSRSLDGGISWERYDLSATEGMVQALAFDPTNYNIIYIGGWCLAGTTRVGKVYKSLNSGDFWADVSTGLETASHDIQALAVHPFSPDTIFAGADGGLFRTIDGGSNWQEIGSFDSVRSVIIDPNLTRIMYLGTAGGGVFRSTDWGNNWRSINTGLISKRVNCLAFNSDSELLYAGTEYGGAFRIESAEGWDITGCISYYSNENPVDSAMVCANPIYVDITDANGYYELLSLPTDNIVVRPEKINAVGGAITALDVSFILRHYVGLTSLNPYQKIAADVSGDKRITPYDASLILLYGVRKIKKFPIMPDPSHFWKFVPQLCDIDWKLPIDSIAYNPLDNSMYDQDYYGIIFGDVTGNWAGAPKKAGAVEKPLAASIEIRPQIGYDEDGKRFRVSLHIDNETEILAINFTLEFDPTILKVLAAKNSKLTEDFLIAYNIEPGLINVALAGSKPVTNSGSFVDIEFEMLKDEKSKITSLLNVSEMKVNEYPISVNIQKSEFNADTSLPEEYALSQNYPNPFNAETLIKYQLPKSSRVILKIYNTLGQEIRTLVNEEIEAGYHEVSWDGRDDKGTAVSSGIIIYRLKAGEFVKSRKMLLLR